MYIYDILKYLIYYILHVTTCKLFCGGFIYRLFFLRLSLTGLPVLATIEIELIELVDLNIRNNHRVEIYNPPTVKWFVSPIDEVNTVDFSS